MSRFAFHGQRRHERNLEALGVTPNYSCACYEQANIPAPGDRLGWAESSAVQYANSVLGARTNRNSVLIDICSAVTGLTPEFGYLLDENRRGRVLIKLKIERMNPDALGFVVGQRVGDDVPVIEHFELGRADLKNLGGAMAASGAVALFHIEGVTPEAPDLRSAFDGPPERTVAVTQADLDGLRTKTPEQARLVVFGCPQMTREELLRTAAFFVGRRVARPTWFCVSPHATDWLDGDPLKEQLRRAGVQVHTHCPLAALALPTAPRPVLTTSGKLHYYLANSLFGDRDDCLRASGVRR
jgi:predicted aconitase